MHTGIWRSVREVGPRFGGQDLEGKRM